MKSYTPYENVADRAVPAAARDDVSERHPGAATPSRRSGWLALRAWSRRATVLLKTEMGAGHGGPSGRYDSWREEAFILSWVLDRVGLADAKP